MNTKAVCKKLNVTPKMLRIYEEHGLICPKRRENNYREYSAENLVQIETIAILRHLGFSIMEIKEMLKFDKTNNKHLDMFYLQYKAIDTKIKELQRTKVQLKDTINTLIESDDRQRFADIILADRDTRYDRMNYEDLVMEWNFDAMALNFVNRYLKEDRPYQDTIKRVREILRGFKGSSFIDMGCGTCDLWNECDPDTDLLAVDLSFPMLLESKRRLPWLKIRLDDITAVDANTYDRYDVVVSTFLIHHIEPCDQYKAVDNLLKLCREDGVVVLADRCYRSESDMKAAEKKIRESNDEDAINYFKSEFFIVADRLKSYLSWKGYLVTTEFTDDNMIICMIEKQK